MNEFARKALELADEAAEAKSSLDLSMTEVWRSEAYRARLSKQLDEARAALVAHLEGAEQKWLPIETAPRDSSRVLVASCDRPDDRRRSVYEAWWRIPYAGAPDERGWWCYDGDGTMLDRSVHGIGATHWMPLPATPTEEQSQ